MVLVTASTRKAATGVNGTKVHFAFNLPICKLGKKFCYRKLLAEELHKKCHLYKYLNSLMLDEVLVLQVIRRLNLPLQDIKAIPKVLEGISVIRRGDLLQLPPVQQQQKK